MYGICCVPFSLRKTACQKYFFQILSQKETLRQRISKIRIWIWSEESIQSMDFMDPWSGFGFAQKNEKSVFGFGNPDLGFPKKCTLGWVQLGNPDLDFEIWISDFAIEREIRKRIAPPRNPSSEWIEIKKSKSRFLGFPFYRSIGNPKKDLQNSGLLFANYTCACKTAVVKDSFSNPFLDFQSNGQKWKYKNRYLSVEISFRFPARLQIRNPDFKSHIQISQSNAPYVRL